MTLLLLCLCAVCGGYEYCNRSLFLPPAFNTCQYMKLPYITVSTTTSKLVLLLLCLCAVWGGYEYMILPPDFYMLVHEVHDIRSWGSVDVIWVGALSILVGHYNSATKLYIKSRYQLPLLKNGIAVALFMCSVWGSEYCNRSLYYFNTRLFHAGTYLKSQYTLPLLKRPFLLVCLCAVCG